MTTDAPAIGAPRPFLSLAGISKRFGGTTALEEIDWSVEAGEVHCLVGENGSGKSTLIKIISGVHVPDRGGSITIDGSRYSSLTPKLAKSLGVQVIFQDLSLFPNLTVLENIAIDCELHSPLLPPPRRAMRDAATAALARLNAQLHLDAKVGMLPVAQRQIVAICRGLAANARVLFMDEPTASLTRREVELLLETVRRLKALGVAVVFVSHRLEEVVEIAERVTVLRDGRKVGTFPASEIDDHSLAELMTGESIVHAVTARPLRDARPALEVRGASRAGEFENVSLVVRRGEILSLIGLLGAGRTELALALFGMSPLERGEILLDGAPLILRSNQDAVRAGIAYVSEDRLTLGLNLKQSIADNVAITVLDRLADVIGLVSPSRRNTLASDWIARLGIRTPNADAAVLTLSGGNQQRVVLAKWLATDPKVLILDSLTAEGHIGSGVREDRSNRWVVAALGVLGIIDAYLPAYTDRIGFLTFGGEGVRWLGFLLYTVGGVLRLAPVFVLGRRFSGLVAIQPEHRLATSGLYGIIRHPSYLGLFVLALGWGLAFRSGVGVVIAVLMLVVALARIESEERLLSESFGAEYDAYRARTWRLIPYVY